MGRIEITDASDDLVGMSETLRPRPFCGGEARVYQHVDDRGRDGEWMVDCLSVDGCIYEDSSSGTRQDAVAFWNHRYASPAARHVAEKIRNAIRAGMTVDVFGTKRLTGVVLDLETAEEFAKEVGDGI